MIKYILIILIFLILIRFLKKNKEHFTSGFDIYLDNNINFLQNLTQSRKAEEIEKYLGREGLALNLSDYPIEFNYYLDERSNSMFNSIKKSKEETILSKLELPKVLLPNVGCREGTEINGTCNKNDLELKEPSLIELSFKNKPFKSLTSPNDEDNYCHKGIVNCYDEVCIFER